jgi:DNA-binding NarL/FixJ family response regulator
MELIRVLIADDHPVVRAGLSQLAAAAPDIEVCCTAEDGEEAVQESLERRPDVVLMDLSMPGMDGIEATRRILADAPATRIVALTSFSDQERIIAALDAGATGYLLKDSEPVELMAGIRAAARGESPLDPKAAAAVLRARTTARRGEELSEREREVLALVARGLPNKLIARELGVSEKTVKAHLTRVFRRIGVDDRTQAALWAQRHGVTSAQRS